MSLPFADSPDKSSIYNDLKVKKLDDLTADDFDAFRARMDAQGVEGLEDEYRRLLLLGLASNKISTSGVIAASGGIINYVQTVGNNSVNIIPPKGEVWKIMGLSLRNTVGVSGSNYYNTFLGTPETVASNVVPSQVNGDVFYSSIASSSAELLTESLFEEVFQPLIITENMFLRIYSNGAAWNLNNTVSYNVAYMRER